MFTRSTGTWLSVLIFLFSTPSLAKQWTLESSLAQALDNALELKVSAAEIAVRETDIKMAEMWPDPELELRVDNKLGKDDGSGGADLTEITISQEIPLSRTKYQSASAKARMQSSEYAYDYQQLQIQNRISKLFHRLQLMSSRLQLADKRIAMADKIINPVKTSGTVVRYLSPLEKMRLNIIRENAHQARTSAEGEYDEVVSEFIKLLGLETEQAISVTELTAINTLPELNVLLNELDRHALLSSQQKNIDAAAADIDVAKGSQLKDPTISLSRSEDYFDSGKDDVYALMVNVQIPIHDRKSTAVSKARYQHSQQKIELQRIKRELSSSLRRSYYHLQHLQKQADDYEHKIIKPAKKMLDLTNKAFVSGELNVLSLIDANNTYVDAQLEYMNLLYQGNIEQAEIHLYSGQLIVKADGFNALTGEL